MALVFARRLAAWPCEPGGILHCGPGMTRFAAPAPCSLPPAISYRYRSCPSYPRPGYWLLVVSVGLVEEAPKRLPGSRFDEAQVPLRLGTSRRDLTCSVSSCSGVVCGTLGNHWGHRHKRSGPLLSVTCEATRAAAANSVSDEQLHRIGEPRRMSAKPRSRCEWPAHRSDRRGRRPCATLRPTDFPTTPAGASHLPGEVLSVIPRPRCPRAAGQPPEAQPAPVVLARALGSFFAPSPGIGGSSR